MFSITKCKTVRNETRFGLRLLENRFGLRLVRVGGQHEEERANSERWNSERDQRVARLSAAIRRRPTKFDQAIPELFDGTDHRHRHAARSILEDARWFAHRCRTWQHGFDHGGAS